MLFSLSESTDSKIKSRIGPIKEISSQLNAKYYHGIGYVRNTFFTNINQEMENSNVIVGKNKLYNYCFIEYYHIGRGKKDYSRWVSKASFRLNEESFPNFELLKKKTVIYNLGCLTAIVANLVFFSLFFLIAFFHQLLFVLHHDTNMRKFVMESFFTFLVIGAFGFIAYLIFLNIRKTYKQIKNQSQYYIRNPEFREKYVIITDDDARSICKVFTEKVCSKIVNYKPEIENICISNNCLLENLPNDEQLTYQLCLEYISKLTEKAQIFEKDGEDLYSSF